MNDTAPLSDIKPDIRVENDGDVRTITLQRADGKGNALSQKVIGELAAAFKTASENPDVKIIVLRSKDLRKIKKTGQPDFFCAGVDVREMQAAMETSEDERPRINYKQCANMAELFHIMDKCPKPIIGATDGVAIGGGVTLLALCDRVVAKTAATFSYPEAEFKMLPWISVPYLMRRLLDEKRMVAGHFVQREGKKDAFTEVRKYLNGGLNNKKGVREYTWNAMDSYDWGIVDYRLANTDSLENGIAMAILDLQQHGKRQYKKKPPAYEAEPIVESRISYVQAIIDRDKALPDNAEKMIQFVTAYLRGEKISWPPGKAGEEKRWTEKEFREQCIQNWANMRCSDEPRKVLPVYNEHVGNNKSGGGGALSGSSR